MFHGMDGYGIGIGWFWIIFFLVFVIIVWFVVRSINQNNADRPTDQRSALDILKERYARGEINKQEYEEKKKDLLD